jgi:hypothetical protein
VTLNLNDHETSWMDTSRPLTRMSTIHPCLKALNILSTICDFALQAPEDGPKTLAAVAVTCRAFENTALDVLWRTLPNLVPLVKCLPPDAWKVKVDKRKENKLVWVSGYSPMLIYALIGTPTCHCSYGFASC